MKKNLPYYMMLALYEQFDMSGFKSEVEVKRLQNEVDLGISDQGMGWLLFTEQINKPGKSLIFHNIVSFNRMLELIPDALRKWAEEDPDIKRILVEVEL